MKPITAGSLITYQGMSHRVIRIFNFQGDLKVELKNLHNDNQFIVFLIDIE